MRAVIAAVAFAVSCGGGLADSGDPRFDTFLETCIPNRQDYEATKKRAEATGWRAADESAHPSLARVLAKAADVKPDPGITPTLVTYQRQIDGRSYYLIVNFVGSEMMDFVGCSLYDFDAGGPMAPKLLVDWLGEAPGETKHIEGTIIAGKWNPPKALPGTWDVFTAYVPVESSLASEAGFSGLVLKITSVDPKE